MTRTLLRNCVGCGRSVRGKPRCTDCQRTKDRAKRARRPDLDDARERERRRRLVADHRATVGDWCPGLANHPAHPSADLVADHVVEIAAGGLASGPLRVLCRSENSRRSAWLATGLGPLVAAAATTPRPPHFPTLFESTDPGDREGPVVA
jgi:5-methylcytosine-specific restriction enzyme A